MTALEESKIIKTDENTWKFPDRIKFETANTYNEMFSDIASDHSIVFDLSDTQVIHSSFMGFLIELKQRLEAGGGELRIKPSHAFEKLIDILDLHNFFLEVE